MSNTAVYIAALYHMPKVRAEQIKKLLLLRKRPIIALDLSTWLFSKQNNLSCETLDELIGRDVRGECLRQGYQAARVLCNDLDKIYHYETLNIGSLLLGRMQRFMGNVYVMQEVAECLRKRRLTPLVLGENFDTPLSDYDMYACIMRTLAFFCKVALPVPTLQLPASLHTFPNTLLTSADAPLMESVPDLNGQVILAAEEGEMPRYQSVLRTLRHEGQEAQGLTFPFDYDWYNANTPGEHYNTPLLRTRPPKLFNQPEFFGSFSIHYPGESKDLLLHEVWHCLNHVFLYYHSVYFPWLARYWQLWRDLLQNARPKAVLTSTVHYPASILPGLAAKSLDIPTFGLQHSYISEMPAFLSQHSLLTDMPYWRDHCQSLGMRCRLVKQDTPLVDIQRQQATVEAPSARTVLILAAASPTIEQDAPYSSSHMEEILHALGTPPPDIEEHVQMHIKWHPFFGDSGYWAMLGEGTRLQLINAHDNIAEYLDNAWMVVGLDYISSGLLESLVKGIPTCLFLTPAWQAYADLVYARCEQHNSGYFEALHTLQQPEDLWNLIRAWLKDANMRQEYVKSMSQFTSKTVAQPGEGDSLKDIINQEIAYLSTPTIRVSPSPVDMNVTQKQDCTLTEEELYPPELLAGQEAAYARDIAKLYAQLPNFVDVPCPACTTKDAPVCFTKFGFSFRRCPQCATIYMSPRPTETIMAAYYANSENYRYWAEHIFPATEISRREKVHRPRLERIADYCRRFSVPLGMMLEMGPGFGTFAALATSSQLFQKVAVVEPTPELAEACRQRHLETHACRIEELPSSMEQAQCIVAFEVIEHLFAVRPVIQSLVPRLAPGGLLVLTCPNGQGFDIATLGAASHSVDSEHVNLFNPASLSLLVQDCGLTVLEVSTPGKLDAEFVREAALKQDISLDAQPFLQRVLRDEWERLGPAFQNFLAENGLSSHMWLVAQKKS